MNKIIRKRLNLVYNSLKEKKRGFNINNSLPLSGIVSLLLFIALAMPAMSQDIRKKIDFELKNESLHSGLKKFEKISGFHLAYTLPLVEKYKSITIANDVRSVEETLKLLLQNTSLNYVIKGKTIMLMSYSNEKNKLRKVTGVVSDKNDFAIPGVTIRMQGGNLGTITDVNGFYSIEVPENAVLAYSFMGLRPINEAVSQRSVINVKMEQSVIELDALEVVSSGYQSLPKERTTGAFGFVTAKDLKKNPSVNIMEKLEGSSPGVNFDVRKNTITIRGKNTFGSTDASSPLIVVDGFPYSDQSLTSMVNATATGGAVLSRINPDDIESITILKDAAATSIWGAKAANGVIVIETKKGKSGSPIINFSSSLSLSAPSDLSQLNRMSSAEYIDLESEMKAKGFITDPTKYSSYYTFNQNKPVSDALEAMFKVDRGTSTAAERDATLSKLAGYSNYDQIKKYLLQRAVSQQYNLSLSGGGPTNTYYISSNYTKDVPVFRSNKSDNYFLTANFGNSFLKDKVNLKIGINYNYSNSQSNAAAINALGTSTLGLRPYDMLVDESGNRIQRSLTFINSVADAFEQKGYQSWRYNPIDELNYSNAISKESRLHLNASLDAKITSWLSASVSGAIQKMNGNTETLDEADSYNMRLMYNLATTVNSAGKLVSGIPAGGLLNTTARQSDEKNLRGQLNVSKSWNDKVNVNWLGGAEIRESTGLVSTQRRYGFNEDTNTSTAVNPTVAYTNIYGFSLTIGNTGESLLKSINRFLSYYTNASVGLYNDRYIVSGSLRYDDYTLAGMSRDKRARPLWSVGAKWNLGREHFMGQQSLFSTLNLHGSIGTSGSIPSAGSNIAVMSISGSDYTTGETYGSISTPADDNLTWETTTSYNLGVDWSMFNNRFRGTFDVYHKNTKDILYSLPVNTTYGWSTLQKNGASMKGHGFDLGLTGKVINNSSWGWDTGINFSYNTNEVTDARFAMPTTTSLVSSTTPIVGLPLDYVYAYSWAGLDNTGQSQIKLHDGTILKSTDYSKTVTAADLKNMGRLTAPYFGGFTNTLHYKDFTLSANITYSFGNVFRRQSVSNYPQWTGSYTGVIGSQKDLANRWRNLGDEEFTNVPGLEYINYNSYTRYQNADILIEDASNVKLRQVSLSYSLPASMLSKTSLKSLSAGFTVRNLGLIWAANSQGIDPDYVSTNTYTNLAPSKTYYFTINVTF